MHLKSIEIQGFKSFPDQTEIQLSRGITAIVGPNGSGKSNIVDAVRWVLGEQSTKTLRGGKMEDVIFGGTNKRTPSGYSEVSMTIDNSEGLVPLDYNEVTVTRRYYRSGESEFYINRKSVRLKDIHELFMDTGLGRDGYSIIGQGRIDEILSVKSGDRRDIFEEAAGITKFRYRKEEAERKLDGTEENLVRIRDIITELEGQVEPLREQAEKAKKFLLCRDELRTLEVSLWLKNLEKIKETSAKNAVDFENAQRLLSAKKRELDELYEEIDALSEEIHRREMDIETQRGDMSSLTADLSAAQSRVAVCQTNIANMEENTKAIEEQLLGAENKRQSLEGQLESQYARQQEIGEKKEQIKEEIEGVRRQMESCEDKDLAARLEQVQDEKNLLLQEQSRLTAELAAGRRQLEELAASLQQSFDVVEELCQRKAQLVERKKEIATSIAQQKEQEESAGNVVSGFGLVLKSKEEKAQRLYDSADKRARAVAAMTDRLNLLKALERDYEGFSHAVRSVMSAGEKGALKGIHGTVAQLMKTPQQYATAIEIALGGALQNIVTANEDDAKSAIQYLKMREGGRATFLPITAIRGRSIKEDFSKETGFVGMAYDLVSYDSQYDGIIKNLLGTTLVAETIDHAVKIGQKHRGKVRIVTLDGQVVSQSGAMTGGSVGKSTGILSRAGEIETLTATLAKEEQQLSEEKAAYLTAKQDYDSGKYQVDVAKAQLEQATKALAELNAQLEGNEQLLQALESQQSRIEEDDSANQSKAQLLQAGIQAAQTRQGEITAELEQLDAQAQDIYAKQSGQNQQLEQLSAQIAQNQEAFAQLEGELAGVQLMQQQIKDLIEQAKTEQDDRASATKGLQDKLEQAKVQLEQEQQQEARCQQAITDKNARITQMTQDKLEVDGKRNAMQRDSQNRNNAILNLEREAARLEGRKEQDEAQIRSIIDKMWESYELSPMTAISVATHIEDLNEAGRRVAQLKNQIRALGDVNVLSIEEYAKTSERFEFLSAQRNDLEKAKGDILKVIDDLTKNMQTTFAEHFTLINDSFTQTFQEIFGGGNAYLQLEDENDILNCGIEIKVELPGKTIKTISLLSGGEKAFVAIALYFAILKVRPTPFCILDEIEAALDDVNVLKYINYMHTLCHNTQFIVITHRRGTMEGSDMLYGVTMQETGVSKLLAININEMEKLLA